jgi:hypothetical protein
MKMLCKMAAAFACACFLQTSTGHARNGSSIDEMEARIRALEAGLSVAKSSPISLQLSGWVSEQIVHWDDGVERNTYMTGLGSAFASNINFKGQARISRSAYAGYVLHIEAISSDVYTTTNDIPNGGAALTGGGPNSLQLLYSYWFLEHGDFGRLSLGKVSPADVSAVVGLDTSGTLAAAYWVAYDVFAFQVRGSFSPGQSLTWGNASACRGYGRGPGDCNGVPLNVVRYDSPTVAGFRLSASWGDDDNWALALRYINAKVGGFVLKAVATYSETSNESAGAPSGDNLEYAQASAYLQHSRSGWFVHGAWGHLDQSDNPLNNPVTDTWYLKSGVRFKAMSLGATIPYTEYLHATDSAFIVDNGSTPDETADDVGSMVPGSNATFWGFGVVQEIDSADMSMWLRYREHRVDLPNIRTDKMSTVVFGALINF